jgi:hypothetical protein
VFEPAFSWNRLVVEARMPVPTPAAWFTTARASVAALVVVPVMSTDAR